MNNRERNELDRHITGNHGENQFKGEAEWEMLFDDIDQDATKEGMCDIDARTAWKLGVAAWRAAKGQGARFAHETTEDACACGAPRRKCDENRRHFNVHLNHMDGE